jgi:hypothetical protein
MRKLTAFMIPALPFPTENKALDLRESPEGLKVLFVSPSGSNLTLATRAGMWRALIIDPFRDGHFALGGDAVV